MKVQKITPFIWFDSGAEDAARFYTTVFSNSKILNSDPLVTTMEIEGLQLMMINGGPAYQLNESFSLYISCDTQDEIDYYWNKLTDGGEESRCGWLKDKFGLSWQVVPSVLGELMKNPERRDSVMNAFLKMKKFIIRDLPDA